MSRPLIRPASVRDAEGIVALNRALAEAGAGMVMTPDQVRTVGEEQLRVDDVYRAMSAGEATLCVVAVAGDDVVGTADLRQFVPTRAQHVGVISVGVHPDHQRAGIGRALLEHLVDHARAAGLVRLELYVRADNERAIGLYRSLGFALEGTRRRFVRLEDGRYVDDHVMALFLDPP